MTRRLTLVFVALAAMVALSGCFFRKKASECASVEEYQASRNLPAVQVPEGLSKPEQPNRLNIPSGPVSEQPLSANAACLARPPDYFNKKAAPAAKPAN